MRIAILKTYAGFAQTLIGVGTVAASSKLGQTRSHAKPLKPYDGGGMKLMTDMEVLEYTSRVRNVYLFAMKYIENLASASALEAGYRARISTADDNTIRELVAERPSVTQRLDAFKLELQRLLKIEDESEAAARAWELTIRYDAFLQYKVSDASMVTSFEYVRWLQSFRELLPTEPAALHPDYPVNISPLMPRSSLVMQ